MVLTGHCNCKAITISIEDPAEGEYSSIYCHCTTCKRQSGAFGTCFVVVDDERFKLDDPQGVQKTWVDTLTDSGTNLDRQFCGICACPLTSVTPLYPGKTIVKVGLFDNIPKTSMEMYCKDREPWGAKFDEKLGVVEFQGMLPG